ncbi:coproporphyrinogen III oxidase [Klebsiella pneumoniae subsp. pneumoniae]|nr:coproporphyrinogen III oxidase [Klebsiella pneumoniae subsp. pneumoniae]
MDGAPFIEDAGSGKAVAADAAGCCAKAGCSEQAGVNFSHVHGDAMPASATAHRPELAGRSFGSHGRLAGGSSAEPLRAHQPCQRAVLYCRKPGADPVWWFGGGFDLTPCYGFEEDASTGIVPPAICVCRSARKSIRAIKNGAMITSISSTARSSAASAVCSLTT